MLDGLLENDTILRPREHYTDTHGFTERMRLSLLFSRLGDAPSSVRAALKGLSLIGR